MTTTQPKKREDLAIPAPRFRVLEFRIVGTAPLVVHRFNQKEYERMQAEGSTAKNAKSKRPPKDFNKNYEEAKYVSEEGWLGFSAPGLRCGMISACRLVGFKMTMAKLSLWVLADGYDPREGTPLVRIYGEPEMALHAVRNDNGSPDIRARPMWKKWSAIVRVRYDEDQFKPVEVANLLMRVGAQVGIGEGRNDSKQSAGMGWGSFELDNGEQQAEAAE